MSDDYLREYEEYQRKNQTEDYNYDYLQAYNEPIKPQPKSYNYE